MYPKPPVYLTPGEIHLIREVLHETIECMRSDLAAGIVIDGHRMQAMEILLHKIIQGDPYQPGATFPTHPDQPGEKT